MKIKTLGMPAIMVFGGLLSQHVSSHGGPPIKISGGSAGKSAYFKHLMGEIINSYLIIKNDLSSDRTTHVTEESGKIIRKTDDIAHLIKSTVHRGEFHRFHKEVDIHKLRSCIEKLPGQPIKEIRRHFKPISEFIVKYIELFGKPVNVKEEKLYTYHCPMYEGGSDWVQANKKIANPFYGSSMLACGTLKSESSGESGSKTARDQNGNHKEAPDHHH